MEIVVMGMIIFSVFCPTTHSYTSHKPCCSCKAFVKLHQTLKFEFRLLTPFTHSSYSACLICSWRTKKRAKALTAIKEQQKIMSCIEECLIVLNRHHTASFAFQRLPNGPEILWTRWWVHSQTSGRQQHRGLCETKQPTSCSVEPGRSFFGCSSVWTGHGRAGAWREQPEAMQRVQASTDVRLHSHTFTCTQLLFGAAHWVLPIDISSLWEHLDTLTKGNYAWKCPI